MTYRSNLREDRTGCPGDAFPAEAWLRRIVFSLVFLVGGCSQQQAPTAVRSAAPQRTAREHLAQAVDYLQRLDEFEREQAILQTTYHLNRWLSEQARPATWQPDAMVETLPRAIREGPAIEQLDDLQFQIPDVDEFLEAVWLRRLADWVGASPVASPLADDLQRQAEALPVATAERLILTYRLFDWIVRNVQLDGLLDYPADPVRVGTDGAAQRRLPPPRRGIPGPGYQLHPWQVLLYGHGDALARARLFILLARQQGIPVVMLAFPGQTNPPRPRPWVCAALIEGELYLFDTRLGLPIPAPESGAVATLAQVMDDPQLLSDLDVGEEFTYRVPDRDTRSIQALIDASATALSLRMQLVEQTLTGEDRVQLTVHAKPLAEQLIGCRGIEEVALWVLPFETDWYEEAVAERLSTDEQFVAEHFMRYGLFQGRNTLVRARYQHLRGQFESRGEDKGAKMLYLDARVPNRRIQELDSSAEVQAMFGLRQEAYERDILWMNRLAATKAMMAQTKVYASYWLGLAHYDAGNFSAATEWFKTRTLESFPQGPWTGGARYNLGRSSEAMGNVSDAREVYLVDDSHQEHGNILRARLLRRHLRNAAEGEDATSAAVEASSDDGA